MDFEIYNISSLTFELSPTHVMPIVYSIAVITDALVAVSSVITDSCTTNIRSHMTLVNLCEEREKKQNEEQGHLLYFHSKGNALNKHQKLINEELHELLNQQTSHAFHRLLEADIYWLWYEFFFLRGKEMAEHVSGECELHKLA